MTISHLEVDANEVARTYDDFVRAMQSYGLHVGEVSCTNPETLGMVVCQHQPNGSAQDTTLRVEGFEAFLRPGKIYRNVQVWPLGEHPQRAKGSYEQMSGTERLFRPMPLSAIRQFAQFATRKLQNA